MAATFPCPNPACTQVFSPEAIHGASSLICPRCGTRFQLGSGRAAHPGPAARAAVPATPRSAVPPPVPSVHPKPVTPAADVEVALPVAEPVAQPDADIPATGNLVTLPSRYRRGRGRRLPWGPIAGLAFVAVLGVGLAVWGALWLRRATISVNPTEASTPGLRSIPEGNCALQIPPAPWQHDEAIKLRMGVNVAMSRQHPSNHFALYYKDYKTRMPGPGQLQDTAVAKLKAYFGSPEWESKSQPKARLAGQPAGRIEFVATDPDQVPVSGECVMLAHLGYGYWFFTWGPEGERPRLLPQWQSLRQGFELLDRREGWREQLPQAETAVGTKARYELQYSKEFWSSKEPDAFDPAADLALEAFELKRGSRPHAGKEANLLVVLLPHAVDLPAAANLAREHLLKQLQAEGQSRLQLTPIKETGAVADNQDGRVGALEGRWLKLHLAADEGTLDRYILMAVIQRPEGTLVLRGNCDWQRRDFWEPEFLQVIATLKVP